jgi:hypothetical protein
LAAGYFGFGIISYFMVDHAAFQVAWYCGGRCVEPFEISHYASWAAVATGIEFYQRMRQSPLCLSKPTFGRVSGTEAILNPVSK